MESKDLSQVAENIEKKEENVPPMITEFKRRPNSLSAKQKIIWFAIDKLERLNKEDKNLEEKRVSASQLWQEVSNKMTMKQYRKRCNKMVKHQLLATERKGTELLITKIKLNESKQG